MWSGSLKEEFDLQDYRSVAAAHSFREVWNFPEAIHALYSSNETLSRRKRSGPPLSSSGKFSTSRKLIEAANVRCTTTGEERCGPDLSKKNLIFTIILPQQTRPQLPRSLELPGSHPRSASRKLIEAANVRCTTTDEERCGPDL